jgi:hypothetical protein
VCNPDDETEQETLTSEEVKALYGEVPFLLLAHKGGTNIKNKRLKKRYEMMALLKKPPKPQKRKISSNAKLRKKLKQVKLETYKKVSYLKKQPRKAK